jgi:metal-dependent amidase/aminoacylase/carboxypeptidase family protein
MYSGINCLRQHITSDSRIHGIITSGGDAPNTVPDFAECKFHIRANDRTYLNSLTQKVINCAKGAELMTGAVLKYEKYENSFDNLLNLPSLQDLMRKNLIEVGITNFLDEKHGASGSSDIGNVSQVCPTMYTELALNIDELCFVHDEAYLKYVNSEEAYDKLHKSVKAMIGAALELYLEPELLNDALRLDPIFIVPDQSAPNCSRSVLSISIIHKDNSICRFGISSVATNFSIKST